MKTKVVLAFAALMTSCFVSYGTEAIYTLGSPIVNPANNHSYYLLSASSWTGAEAYAQTLGGHLVTINDANEQEWVYTTFSNYGGGDRTLWIGLNDVATEGDFVWVSGEPVTYLNWHFFEPNNYDGVEDYGYIFSPSDWRAGSWNDSDNFNTQRPEGITLPVNGVVEVVPEPSSLALISLSALASLVFRKSKHMGLIPGF